MPDQTASPGRAAGDLFGIARRQREPAYERGQFYQDARGTVFFRVLGNGDGWSLMPEGTPYPGDYPRRPLRRLVPEPSWLPERVIRAVADVLTEYTERDRAEEATARICKLILEENPHA